MARSQKSAERRTKPEDIWRYGYRYVKRGREYDTVPLTEDDLLHPQEGDHVVTNDFHVTDLQYLMPILRDSTKEKQNLRVLGDHIIDFQHGGVQALGPDVTVLEGEPLEWDRCKGTFPVVAMKSRVLLVIEFTSPSTRRKDLREKVDLYYRAGVPLYIVVDGAYGGSKNPRGVLPFRAGPEAYELLPVDENGRFWLDAIGLSIGIKDGHVLCFDKNGDPIGNYSDVVAQYKQAKAEAEAANARVAEETARADAALALVAEEKARADEEKARANAATTLMAEEKARADEEKARANAATTLMAEEKARADEEKARANAATTLMAEEKARADEEKARADEAIARVRELEARLKKPKRRKSP